MGRIYDALRRAEQERRLGIPARPEPSVVVDDTMDARVESAGDAARAHANGAETNGVEHTRAERVAVLPLDIRPSAVEPPASLVALTAPGSPACEHLRALRSRIVRLFRETGYRTLLVTSPSHGNGKSTLAANLALLLATEIDRRVLLVDGDLRKPAVGGLFSVPGAPGLADVALGDGEWRDAVTPGRWNGLRILPSGSLIARPTEALNGSRTRAFFEEVKSEYDYVVVDAPPVLPIADAMVLAGLVDAVLLVVRAGKTNRDSVLEAVDALGKANLIGVALNAVPAQPFGGSRYYAY